MLFTVVDHVIRETDVQKMGSIYPFVVLGKLYSHLLPLGRLGPHVLLRLCSHLKMVAKVSLCAKGTQTCFYPVLMLMLSSAKPLGLVRRVAMLGATRALIKV